MRSVFFGRGRRLTACTALALSAGMLLATPASAEEPAPRPSVTKPTPTFTPPKLPAKPESGRAGAAAATSGSFLLSDLDGDNSDDQIIRALDGELYALMSSGASDVFQANRGENTPKDIIPIGNQGSGNGPEVLMLSGDGTLTMYVDAYATGYTYATSVGGGWQIYNKILTPGDVNGDGRADVLARAHDGSLYVYVSTGDVNRPFYGRAKVGSGWNMYDQVVGLGDANGDGHGDVYARDTAGKLWIYRGTGISTRPFGGRVLVGTGWHVYNQIVGWDNGSVAARDKNGTLYYYAGRGNGTLASPVRQGSQGYFRGVEQFAGAGNIPYIGKTGVFARSTQGELFWYGHTTTGTLFGREQSSDEGGWNAVDFLHMSSMDANGWGEGAYVYDGHLYIRANHFGSGWDAYNTLVGPGDLSGDGKGDLLARDRSGNLYLYRGYGDGARMAARIKVGSGWGVYNKLLGAGDYTGDGRMDLIARTSGGDLYLYAGTGSSTSPFKGRQKIGSGWNVYKQLVAPGDLNADGKGDLLGVTSGGDLYRYLNVAPSKFSGRAKIGYGYGIYNSMS
ncbi:VCBS repeat-containing protein [Streptomyces gulbargensis]|uniref:VCBS repeat-containing protein n=1 Tax=Streptomyces gulbargensis TaxID=364901 RepID=A0ABP7MSX7_9ACTN